MKAMAQALLAMPVLAVQLVLVLVLVPLVVAGRRLLAMRTCRPLLQRCWTPRPQLHRRSGSRLVLLRPRRPFHSCTECVCLTCHRVRTRGIQGGRSHQHHHSACHGVVVQTSLDH